MVFVVVVVLAIWLLNSKTSKFSIKTFKVNKCGRTVLWELVKGGKYILKDACCKSSNRVKTESRTEMPLHSDSISI